MIRPSHSPIPLFWYAGAAGFVYFLDSRHVFLENSRIPDPLVHILETATHHLFLSYLALLAPIYKDEGTDLTTSCIMAEGGTHMTQPDSETNFCMSQFWSPHLISAHYTSSSKSRRFLTLTNAFLCLRHKKSMEREKLSPKVINVPKCSFVIQDRPQIHCLL